MEKCSESANPTRDIVALLIWFTRMISCKFFTTYKIERWKLEVNYNLLGIKHNNKLFIHFTHYVVLQKGIKRKTAQTRETRFQTAKTREDQVSSFLIKIK